MFLFLLLSFPFNTLLHDGLGIILLLHALGSSILLSNSNTTDMEMISLDKYLPSSRSHVKPSNT